MSIPITKTTDFPPNLIDIPSLDKEDYKRRLENYIAYNERNYLNMTLGTNLYTQLVAANDAENGNRDNLAQKWKDLLNGKVFLERTYGYERDYKGILRGTTNYTAFFYFSDNQTQDTNQGTFATKSDAGGRIDVANQLDLFWNEAARMNTETLSFLYTFTDIYRDERRNDAAYYSARQMPGRSFFI